CVPTLGVQVTSIKIVRVEAQGVTLYQSVKVPFPAGREKGDGIERLQGCLKAYTVPQLLDDLPTLVVIGDIRAADDFDLGTHRACLLEQSFCLVGIILRALALQVPGIATRVGLVEHIALTVKHRVVDRLAVDGVRCGSAQTLVLKRSAAEVEDDSNTAEMCRPDIILVAVALLEARHVSEGEGINEIDLAGTQSR